MNANLPHDELLQSYERAKAALPDGLPDRPSAAVHERIMRAAREQVDAINTVAPRAESTTAIGLKSLEDTIKKPMHAQDATNDSFWNIRALGSLAVMGLAGLLWWQFEHGTPEEQQAARSASANHSAAAEVVAVTPAAALTSTDALTPAPSPAPVSTSAPTAPPAAVLPRSPAPAPTTANAPEKLAQAKMSAQSRSKAETAEIATPSTPIAQAPAPTTLPSSTPQATRAPAQEAIASGSAQIPQTDKALADAPSRTARPNVAVEPSLQRSLETAQAPMPSAAVVQPPAPAARAAAPRSAPAAAAAPQAIIASPAQLFTAIEARNAPALRQALSQGTSPNARTPEGNPALHQAIMQRWAEGVRILLAAGADRNATSSKGHTASDVALELGFADMTKLLAMPK